MLKATHKGQTDYAIVSSWELCALSGKMPKYYFTEVYQLHATLMLDFLSKLDVKHNETAYYKRAVYFDPENIKSKVAEMEKEWVKYDVKMQ